MGDSDRPVPDLPREVSAEMERVLKALWYSHSRQARLRGQNHTQWSGEG